ncbi:hypothetical protein HJB84_02765 [Rhizobium sp. NZLR1b]|uniref:hypothetical protein n=1 Tax=Rhizobium sp. NZLR1b TaxID=2731099 RepID=UPI001C83B8E2|nr:hypothetical protein [Rhizobium sp. NZLR1b]MBX5168788.1 hypothetical protein [Rhizobium sp. NZLR1b]
MFVRIKPNPPPFRISTALAHELGVPAETIAAVAVLTPSQKGDAERAARGGTDARK